MAYGHDPYKYMPKYGGIAQAGAIVGGAISKIPEQIRSKETHEMEKEDRARKIKLEEEALAAIKEDWKKLENTHKSFKSTYIKYADVLIKNGLMTPEDKDAGIKRLGGPPLQAHKKNPLPYMTTLGSNFNELYKEVKTKVDENNLGEQIQAIIGGKPGQPAVPEQKTTETIPMQQPEPMTEQVTPQQFQAQQAQPPLPQEGFTEETTIPEQPAIPAIPGTKTQEETLARAGEAQARGDIPAGVTGQKILGMPGPMGQQSQKDIDYMEALKRRSSRAWTKINEGKSDDFYKESQALWTDAKDYETLTASTDKMIEGAVADIGENDNAIVTMTQQLENLDPDLPEEAEQIENINNKKEELKKTNWSLNEKKLRYEEKAIEQRQKKAVAEEAWRTYVDGMGTISYKQALTKGREAAKEGATTIPTKKKTKFPAKTVSTVISPDTSLPGGTRPQYIQTFNSEEEARKAGKKAGDTIRLRGVGKVRLK